jgi:hypothetical protein
MVSIAPENALLASPNLQLGSGSSGPLARPAIVAGEPSMSTGRNQPAGHVDRPQVHRKKQKQFSGDRMNKSLRTALALAFFACAGLVLITPASAQSVYGSIRHRDR